MFAHFSFLLFITESFIKNVWGLSGKSFQIQNNVLADVWVNMITM